jgi:hypothetical protein
MSILRAGVKISFALLLVAGLFFLGILVTPAPLPAQASFPQVAPPAAPSPDADSRTAGTIAAIAALFPQPILVNLPVIIK